MASFVVYHHTQYQDGHDEGGHFCQTVEEAIKYINKFSGQWDQHTFRVFELGREVEIEPFETVEPQAPKVVTQYRIKRKGRKKE